MNVKPIALQFRLYHSASIAGGVSQGAGPTGVSERLHGLAGVESRRVPQGDGLQIRGAAGLQDGDVIGCVIADNLGGEATACRRHDDPDRRRIANDVVIRQHHARRRQHHAGARGPPILVGEVGVDDDDAGANWRRARLGEGEAGGNCRCDDGDERPQDDAGTEAPEWVHAPRSLCIVELHCFSSVGLGHLRNRCPATSRGEPTTSFEEAETSLRQAGPAPPRRPTRRHR